MVLLCLALTGCAGMIFSHQPYHLTQGKVTMANTRTVILDWPVDRRYWCGQETLCLGEFVHHVCPELSRQLEPSSKAWISPGTSPVSAGCGKADKSTSSQSLNQKLKEQHDFSQKARPNSA